MVVGVVPQGCIADWGVAPRPLWADNEWGGRRISAASNIVFSNGLLDPWHGGGVLEDVSDSLPALIIPEVSRARGYRMALALQPFP